MFQASYHPLYIPTSYLYFGVACDVDIANSAPMAATFAAATGIFALFFFAEVPRVRIDIVEKIPVIGSYFKKEIPPEDNPF